MTGEATTVRPFDVDVSSSSRLRRAGGQRHPWSVEGGVTVDLPVTLNYIIRSRGTGEILAVTEATVDLRDGMPALVQVVVAAPHGIDVPWTQREFRWSGPIEVVTRMVPAMIRAGRDPFAAEFPVQGFPAVTRLAPQRRLSLEFLEDIAREYLAIGPGYAKRLATAYQVSPRTVVSWVEKARRRGVLSPTEPGKHGGRLQLGGRPEAP